MDPASRKSTAISLYIHVVRAFALIMVGVFPVMSSLHTQESVFSRRHVPSWLLLAFAAGAVNAITFVACSRFVTHVTGSVSNIGMGAGQLAFEGSVLLGCLIAGAMSSAILIDGRHHRGKKPLHAVPLLLTSLLLALVGMLGVSGAFGPFNSEVDGPRDFVFLSVLAFAMGLQNASVATSTGLIVRTTHMTGAATDLGVHLASALYAGGEARRLAVRHAGLRAGKIAAFVVGGVAGAGLAIKFASGAFFVPALLVGGAAVMSFVNVDAPTTNRERQLTP